MHNGRVVVQTLWSSVALHGYCTAFFGMSLCLQHAISAVWRQWKRSSCIVSAVKVQRIASKNSIGSWRLVRKGRSWRSWWTCLTHSLAVCDHSQLAAIPSRKHVIEVAELWDNFKLVIPNHRFPHGSSINQPCIANVNLGHLNTGFGWNEGSNDTTTLLLHSHQAASTEDSISTHCETDSTAGPHLCQT